MEIVQIVGVALISLFIIMILKQYRPEYGVYVSIIAGVIIFGIAIAKLTTIIDLIKSLSNKLGNNMQFFNILIKITGIAYLAEFATNICKDSGETAIASKVEMGAKIIIVAMSIPIIATLLETITNILP